jgi:hypothetical protein
MPKSDDGTLTDNSPAMRWSNLLNEASIKLQQPYKSLHLFSEMLSDAGFTDIVDMRFKWPSNHWPKERKYKELGVWNNENIAIALESLTVAPFTRALGWSIEDVHVLLSSVRRDLNDPRIHAYWPM